MKTTIQVVTHLLIAGLMAGICSSNAIAQTLSPDELKALNATVGKAIDAHDIQGIVSCAAPDATFDFVPAPPLLVGTNAIAGFFAGLFQGFPDYLTIAEQRWAFSNIVVTAHTTTGTLQNTWMGLPATGKGSLPNMHLDIWEYQGDKIQRITTYAELQSMMVSAGFMPAFQLPQVQPVTPIVDPVPTGLTPLAAVMESQARYNQHDFAGLVKMMRADAQATISMLPGVTLDRKGFALLIELYLLAYRDLRMDIVRHLDLGEGWVLSEVVHRGINDGPYFGVPATGRAVNVRGAMLYQVDNQGLIRTMGIYFDNITALTQMGMIPPPLNSAELTTLNTGVGKAIDAHNVSNIVSFMAPDATFDFVPAPPPLTGTNAIAGFFSGLFQGFPDYLTTSEQRWVSGNAIVTEHTTTGTLQNVWMGLPATGKGGGHRHLDIWEYQGDKIQRITTYLDLQSMMVVTGLMPTPQLPPLQPVTPIPDPVPTGLTPVATAIEGQARWNNHDLVGAAKTMRADSQVLFAMLGVPIDRKGFIAMSELYFLAFSDLQFNAVRHLDLGGGWMLSEGVYRGTNNGPYFGVPATGKAVDVRAALVYQVDSQGLIGMMKVYFDNLTVLTQLGLFPPPSPGPKLSIDTCAALTIEGTAGKTVGIEYRGAFDAADAWKPLTDIVLPTTPFLFIDTNSIGKEKRFYRALLRQ